MKASELYEEIQSYCRANADKAVVKKYSRYFKEGYDAYGVSREKYEEKVNSLINDERINMKLVLSYRFGDKPFSEKRYTDARAWRRQPFLFRLIQ